MWREFLQTLLELVYPVSLRCPLCDANTQENQPCPICRRLLEDYARMPICALCGAFMEQETKIRQELCLVCRTNRRPFSLARAVAPYESFVQKAIYRFKYQGQKSLVRPLAMLMADRALQEKGFALADALIPVPIHPRRELQRGYNQSLLLATALGELMHKPVLAGALVKIRETLPQAALSGFERHRNLQGSFAVAQREQLQGKQIILIDDVFTTGSTVSILANILRQAGVVDSQVLTLAGTHSSNHKTVPK